MTLTEGDYFGEGNFTNRQELSAAAYIADGSVLCISIPSDTYKSIFTGGTQLMGTTMHINEANNEEVQSLARHIDKYNELLHMIYARTKRKVLPDPDPPSDDAASHPVDSNMKTYMKTSSGLIPENCRRRSSMLTGGSPTQKRERPRESVLNVTEKMNAAEDVSNEALMLDLLTAFSPELTVDDVVERLVEVTRVIFSVKRASVFIRDFKTDELILKVSRDVQGIRLQMKGMCGHVARTGEVLNVPDAYLDNRFDPTMDKKAFYQTKQVLCVPVMADSQIVGVIQCTNTVDDLPFTSQDESFLALVANELGQVLAKQSNTSQYNSNDIVPIQQFSEPFKINIRSCTTAKSFSVAKKTPKHITCTAQLYHGGNRLGRTMQVGFVETQCCAGSPDASNMFVKADFGKSGTWTVCDEVLFSSLPHGTRIIFQLYSKNGHAPCGWTGCNLFQFDHSLKQGCHKLNLWEGECTTPNVASMERKSADAHLATLTIEFHTLSKESPVLYRPFTKEGTVYNMRTETFKTLKFYLNKMPIDASKRIRKLIEDPTCIPQNDNDKKAIWDMRLALARIPEALSALLLAVDWLNASHVAEVYRLLFVWENLEPLLAIQLLDYRFPDPRIRAYAVHCLRFLDDNELRKYLLQLTQTLKFEPFHDSALARFLLRRALKRPTLIGHIFFWFLKAEMHIDVVRERFGVILDLYLRHSTTHRLALGHQSLVMKRLEMVAEKVKKRETKSERLEELSEQLKRCDFPTKFQLPLNPDMRARGIIIEKCRVMESKKKPLWLVFEDTDNKGKEITVMFKAGDDLRQDQLTLQVLGVMDTLWKSEGEDLCMSPYGCVCTGDELGMLEVVTNSKTLAGIIGDNQKKSKGSNWKKVTAAMDALSNDEVFKNWLIENIREEMRSDGLLPEQGSDEKQMREAKLEFERRYADVQNKFMCSCAGYVVATFVLGIGDRHNDNIMLKRTGELFHIDFGHFLGNFKSKMGFKREKAPFVFTPAFAEILDGPRSETFKAFENLCCKCLLILRKNAGLLVTLFSLMLSCGIPELAKESDIDYLKDRLMLGLDDEQVKAEFKRIIMKSMHTKRTRINDAIHCYVHT